ncbi:YopT-type cysteine protease domain-containing protein [Paraburkholderia sp. BR13439]|uniref:YopT-type cysteine protease domain-containing protein n=1 Tax=Paraburkholderia sp. BR13439 TaxID=3236996 RepID=UPI0034CE4816
MHDVLHEVPAGFCIGICAEFMLSHAEFMRRPEVQRRESQNQQGLVGLTQQTAGFTSIHSAVAMQRTGDVVHENFYQSMAKLGLSQSQTASVIKNGFNLAMESVATEPMGLRYSNQSKFSRESTDEVSSSDLAEHTPRPGRQGRYHTVVTYGMQDAQGNAASHAIALYTPAAHEDPYYVIFDPNVGTMRVPVDRVDEVLCRYLFGPERGLSVLTEPAEVAFMEAQVDDQSHVALIDDSSVRQGSPRPELNSFYTQRRQVRTAMENLRKLRASCDAHRNDGESFGELSGLIDRSLTAASALEVQLTKLKERSRWTPMAERRKLDTRQLDIVQEAGQMFALSLVNLSNKAHVLVETLEARHDEKASGHVSGVGFVSDRTALKAFKDDVEAYEAGCEGVDVTLTRGYENAALSAGLTQTDIFRTKVRNSIDHFSDKAKSRFAGLVPRGFRAGK